jgi:hypothetical protein
MITGAGLVGAYGQRNGTEKQMGFSPPTTADRSLVGSLPWRLEAPLSSAIS